MKGKCCIRIVFSVNSSFEPVIANMVLRFGQPINILRADTKNVEGIARGEMILSLPDDADAGRYEGIPDAEGPGGRGGGRLCGLVNGQMK